MYIMWYVLEKGKIHMGEGKKNWKEFFEAKVYEVLSVWSKSYGGVDCCWLTIALNLCPFQIPQSYRLDAMG